MYVKIVLICLLAVFIQHLLKFVYLLGFHVTIRNHEAGVCKYVDGIEHGSEDLDTLPNGLTFISSGLTGGLPGVSKETITLRGKMYIFDFNDPLKKAIKLELTGFDENKFNPHGISSWQDEKTGKVYLFVVTHPINTDDTIEKFEYVPEKKQLKHIKTYSNELFRKMNDVVAVGESSFYITNFCHFKNSALAFLEQGALMPLGNIVYCDDGNCKIVDDGHITANGIIVTPDKKYLYVVSTLRGSFLTYSINKDHSLDLIEEHSLHSALDNPTVDHKTGDVYIGSHPVIWSVMLHMRDHSFSAPSQVFKLTMKDGKVTSSNVIYENDGDQLSASSVASRYGDQLLIGSVVTKLLHCDKIGKPW